MDVKDRFSKAFATQAEAAEKMQVRKSHFSEALKGDPKRLTEGFLTRFARAYADYIREEWLLTGEGAMEQGRVQGVPSVPLTVAAGPVGTSIGSALESNCEMLPPVAALPHYDFTITVSGDSMAPAFLDGDTIACAWITDAADINPRQPYVLDTSEGAVLKLITGRTRTAITCHSINPHYADYTLPAAPILRIARVVGIIRPLL